MEIAQKIAAKDNCLALITGESVGQVASQTMQAIACTDAVSRIPVFRPLIGSDKTEIVETARMIGTFDTSTLPYEDCCTVFTPKHPKVRPSLEEVERHRASSILQKWSTRLWKHNDESVRVVLRQHRTKPA